MLLLPATVALFAAATPLPSPARLNPAAFFFETRVQREVEGCSGPRSRNRSALSRVRNWAAIYGGTSLKSLPPNLELAVVEPTQFTGPFASATGGPLLLAYVSFGELSMNDEAFPGFRNAEFLVEQNAQWPSYLVDVRSPRWQAYLLEEKIAELIEKGFDGVFLDTLDVADHLESTAPERFEGARRAAQRWISALRQRFPTAIVMANGGLAWVAPVTECIDAIALESLFGGHHGQHRGQEDRESLILTVEHLRRTTALSFFAIDYFAPSDCDNERTARDAYKAMGIHAYVGHPHLQTFRAERCRSTPSP